MLETLLCFWSVVEPKDRSHPNTDFVYMHIINQATVRSQVKAGIRR